MSGRDKVLARDRKISRFAWLKERKHILRLRCAEYGLSTAGKKPDLVDRLFSYLHPTQSSEGDTFRVNGDDQEYDSDDNDDVPISILAASHQVNHPDILDTSSCSMDALRQMIRHEVSIAVETQVARQSNTIGQATIRNPTSTFPVSSSHHAPPILSPPATSEEVPPQHVQGLSHPFTSTVPSDSYTRNNPQLPPLSEKILNDIRSKQFINFHSLLPTALYDPPVTSDNICLEFNQSQDGGQLFSVQPNKRVKRSINTSTSWLEAWNIYIRVMAFYHPAMIPELLAYQDFICTLQRSYPMQSWLRYDTAFRLQAAMNKARSWAVIDEHAFNKFIRCSFSRSPMACFICKSESHMATSCPNRTFRPYRGPQDTFQFSANNPKNGPACRHFNSSKCANINCRYPHNCSKCKGNHPAFKCTIPPYTF